MQKIVVLLTASALLLVGSCSSDCVDCNGVSSAVTGGFSGKICKSDYELFVGTSGVSWATWSAAAKSTYGCK